MRQNDTTSISWDVMEWKREQVIAETITRKIWANQMVIVWHY